MTQEAFLLVILSATLNAAWNLSAKRLSGNLGGIWVALVIAGLVFTPAAALLGHTGIPSSRALALVVLTTLLNTLYFIVLNKAYELGEISLVYPISRGSAVVGTALVGILLFGESVSPTGKVGILLIAAGALALGAAPAEGRVARQACLLALINGAAIAGCAVFAKEAVAVMAPDFFNALLYGGSAILLTPYVLKSKRAQAVTAWRNYRRECLLIGIGSPLSYVLLLYTFQKGNVSYLGPLRECSIVLGALFGHFFLGETISTRRKVGVGLIFVGVVLIRLA